MNIRRILSAVLVVVSLLILSLTMYISYDKKVQSEIKEIEYRIVLNDCYAYEKLGTEYISSEHNREACFFTKENPNGTVVKVEGYKHIHCAVFNEADELFCAAISDEGKRFLLKINEQNKVVSAMEVETLPVKLYAYKDSVVAYYIGHESAALYYVDFSSGRLNLVTDDVTVYNSYDYQRYLKGELDLNEHFEWKDWEYECYRETNDLGYTFFDYNCIDEVLVSDEAILYKSKTAENINQWTLLKNGEQATFENKDVCLGFIDENTLLFYKQFLAGFFRSYGTVYKYNTESKDKTQCRFTVNRGLWDTVMNDSKKYIFYSDPDFGGSSFYCMDIENGVDAYMFFFSEFQK